MKFNGLQFEGFRIVRKHFTIEVKDFTLEEPRAVELRAPSGFGKTSVIRAIAGLDTHEGQVWVGEVRLRSLPVHKRRIGFVFQEQVLFTHQNAIENAMAGMFLQGESRSVAEKRALEGLERFQIRDRAYARVGELSGGERQRVAILRATLWKPRLLILDEPFQGLDHANRVLLQDYISQFLAEHPVPMIWIDHQAKFEGLHLMGEQQGERRIFNLSKS